MEYNELVRKIAMRVSSYLENNKCDKKELIILTHEHGSTCHKFLESPELGAHYRVKCAFDNDYDCDISDCAGVIMFDLTNADLARIVSGVCDTPFTEMVAKALLLGKTVWVPKEEIELLNYCDETPYGKMMYEKLRLLQSYGVAVCSYEDLSETVICGRGLETAPMPCCEETDGQHSSKDFICLKKVVTEKDMINARGEGANRVVVTGKTIFTDLAKEYANNFGIEIFKK